MNIYGVIKRPLITEKSFAQAARGKYTFEVAEDATKAEIKRAVELLYRGTKVSGVAVARLPGKRVRWRVRGRRPVVGQQGGIKKAVVSLSAGKIEVFEKKT